MVIGPREVHLAGTGASITALALDDAAALLVLAPALARVIADEMAGGMTQRRILGHARASIAIATANFAS
jgi:hypothetical protein